MSTSFAVLIRPSLPFNNGLQWPSVASWRSWEHTGTVSVFISFLNMGGSAREVDAYSSSSVERTVIRNVNGQRRKNSSRQGEKTTLINIIYSTPTLRFSVLSSARGWSVEVEINCMTQLFPRQQKALPALQTTNYYDKDSWGFDCNWGWNPPRCTWEARGYFFLFVYLFIFFIWVHTAATSLQSSQRFPLCYFHYW